MRRHDDVAKKVSEEQHLNEICSGHRCECLLYFLYIISIFLDPKVILRCRDFSLSAQLSTALLGQFVAAYRANLQ